MHKSIVLKLIVVINHSTDCEEGSENLTELKYKVQFLNCKILCHRAYMFKTSTVQFVERSVRGFRFDFWFSFNQNKKGITKRIFYQMSCCLLLNRYVWNITGTHRNWLHHVDVLNIISKRSNQFWISYICIRFYLNGFVDAV